MMRSILLLLTLCLVGMLACKKPERACDDTPGGNLFIYSVGYKQSELNKFVVSEYNSTMGTFTGFLSNDTLFHPTPVHNSVDTFLLFQTSNVTDFKITIPSNGRIFSIGAMGSVTGTDCAGPIIYNKVDTQSVYGHYLFLVK